MLNSYSEGLSRQETQLPSRDSYHSEEGPADKAATDRTVYTQPEASVTPKLASVENITILDSPAHVPANVVATASDHEADVSESESEGKPQALQSSQAEPLPEAKSATSNFVTKPIPAGEVTIFIGSNPFKEGTVLFDEQTRQKEDINGRYTLSAEASGESLSQYLEQMGYKNMDEYVFSQLTCFHLHQNVRREAINARIDIPIEHPKDAEPSAQPYLDIDLKVNQHVAMYLPPATDFEIQSEEGGKILLSTRQKLLSQ